MSEGGFGDLSGLRDSLRILHWTVKPPRRAGGYQPLPNGSGSGAADEELQEFGAGEERSLGDAALPPSNGAGGVRGSLSGSPLVRGGASGAARASAAEPTWSWCEAGADNAGDKAPERGVEGRGEQASCQAEAQVSWPSHLLTQHKAATLERDCYSIAAASGIPLWLAAGLPPMSAMVQFLVLYFLAFDNANMFESGRWLEPISTHASVNTTKFLSVAIALFKVGTEFNHAQKLCTILVCGNVRGTARIACCWWALLLQYTMACTVLCVSLSLILSGQSTAQCLLKTIPLWLVIDVDNLAAVFVGMWLKLDKFTLPMLPMAHSEPEGRPAQGLSVLARAWFTLLPVIILLVEGSVSVAYNSVPLTLFLHGHVSNEGAPQMLDHVLPVVEDGLTSHAKYSVLLLAPPLEPPPTLFWVGLDTSGETAPPNSYQVYSGLDGYGNKALCSGRVAANRVQAHYWLQRHHFSSHVYKQLVKSQQLSQSSLPFEASFEVQELPAGVSSYRIFATAQNPRTRALARQVIAAETFFTSACGANCEKCDDILGMVCLRCARWAHRAASGECLACPAQCQRCSETERRCDPGACVPGYGIALDDGACVSCGVESCAICDRSAARAVNATCDECFEGFGRTSEGLCARCAHRHCVCDAAGGCQACVKGWGLLSNTTGTNTCRECDKGCNDCNYADTGVCVGGCTQGFADRHGKCVACPANCKNCSSSGPEVCDLCMPGFGKSIDGSCAKCEVPHCQECNADVWACSKCTHRMGTTPDGQCEPCGEHCNRCAWTGLCEECEEGYARAPDDKGSGVCWSCADQCEACGDAGPALCDRCRPGFKQAPDGSRTCVPAGRAGRAAKPPGGLATGLLEM